MKVLHLYRKKRKLSFKLTSRGNHSGLQITHGLKGPTVKSKYGAWKAPSKPGIIL